jgi:cell division protease FtsH
MVGRVRRLRPRGRLAIALVALVVAGLALALGLPGFPRPGAVGPSSGSAGPSSWTLLDLEANLRAGTVVSIDVAATTAGGQTGDATSGATGTTTGTTGGAAGGADGGELVARTRDGRTIPIQLSVDAADALAAVAAAGFGGLVTPAAWAAAGRTAPAPLASSPGTDPWTGFLPFLVALVAGGLFLVLALRLARRTVAGGDGGTTFRTILPEGDGGEGVPGGEVDPPRAAVPRVRFADVAGCEEAKVELSEAIEFLRAPERFHRLGARIPRGILLYGPPGTGKTMLAKAVATEAGVPFLFASGSEFVEKFVGVGARRIRDLFAQARRLGRAVVFIDEFDAIGKVRGSQTSHEEREQTLNQLLVELDGFGTTDDVVVIAATNRVDTLDPAVLRPGRFTRKIHVGLPDVVGRREILAVHARGKPLAPDVDLDALARKTYGFSGAQLADLLNEAAILAARRGDERITAADLHDGWVKVAVGAGRRRAMDERERSIIAAHEVGHAICGRVHGDRRRVEEISLFAHGEALGVTISSQEDNDLPSESDLQARLIALLGGRAAEEVLFHEVTAGAANDFQQANEIASRMVLRWGMGRDPQDRVEGSSGRGSLSFLVADPDRPLPEEVQAAATRAIRTLLDDAYATARATILDHLDTLERIASYLVEHERIDGATFDALFEGRMAPPVREKDWRAAAARPRPWAEVAALARVLTRQPPIHRPVVTASQPRDHVPESVPQGPAGGAPGPSDGRPPVRSRRRLRLRIRWPHLHLPRGRAWRPPREGFPGAAGGSRPRHQPLGRRLRVAASVLFALLAHRIAPREADPVN